jgi:hypothetical protein
MSNTPIPYRLQVNNSPYFREFLLKETDMVQYQVNNLLQLANELRTEQWNNCSFLNLLLQPPSKKIRKGASEAEPGLVMVIGRPRLVTATPRSE